MAKIRQLIAGRFIKRASLLVVGITLLSGCIRSPEWTLFYFAEQTAEVSQPAQHQYIKGYYDTLEQCQAKGAGLLRIQGISGNEKVDFVCGQQCETHDDNSISCLQLISDQTFIKQL